MSINNKSKLIAGALLKDGLNSDDKIHAALFSAAFEELDGLTDKVARIPADIDGAADRFQRVTTQAVDDFVYVANEALSKFMQRTTEIKASLDALERARTPATPPKPSPATMPQVKTGKPVSASLWLVVPICIAVGIILGATVAYIVLK